MKFHIQRNNKTTPNNARKEGTTEDKINILQKNKN